jgi:hypothetical protein
MVDSDRSNIGFLSTGRVRTMIRLALLTVALVSLSFCTGCAHTYRLQDDPLATPAYSSAERSQQWQRGMDIDFQEMNEDIDNDLLLTGHPSQMTIWNIR